MIIELVALCSDASGGLDVTSCVITTAPINGTATVHALGQMTYTKVTLPPGGNDSLGFTVNDLTGLGPSVEAAVTISVFGNHRDATASPCNLDQIVFFEVHLSSRRYGTRACSEADHDQSTLTCWGAKWGANGHGRPRTETLELPDVYGCCEPALQAGCRGFDSHQLH